MWDVGTMKGWVGEVSGLEVRDGSGVNARGSGRKEDCEDN